MESQINFVDSQTLESNPEVDPGRILVSSQNLNWQGLYIEKGENEAFNPDEVTVTQHYFAMNVGPAFEWEWKDGNTFKTHCYQPGDLWINPAGVPFSHRINTYNQFILVTLDPNKLVSTLAEHPFIERQVFKRKHQVQDRHLQTLIQALLIEAESGGVNGKLYADTLSTALSVHFVNHYGIENPIDFSHLKPVDRQRLGQVIEYIEAYLTEDLSLNDLATVAGLSQFHFSRIFKAALGLTPHQYLMKRRIEKATVILQQESLSLTQVAYQFGFADQSHFTRTFKRFQGVTPRQFLKAV